MRWLLLAVTAVTIGGAACNNVDPAPVFIDLDYQVRCIDCEPRAPDDPKRQLALLDGDMGYQIDCHASTVSKDRVLSFSAIYEDPEDSKNKHSIELLQASFDGKDPGDKCEVRVGEANNGYKGKCTGGEPTADNPCQVKLKVDEGVVRGTVLCIGIPNQALEGTTRYLVLSNPIDPKEDDKQPATFEVQGCAGL